MKLRMGGSAIGLQDILSQSHLLSDETLPVDLTTVKYFCPHFIPVKYVLYQLYSLNGFVEKCKNKKREISK